MVSHSDYLLLTLLTLAVFFDLTQRRIPNLVTFPMVLLGLIIYGLNGGWSGLLQGLAGLGVGMAVFFLPFALGGMGAGDVKLMGAVGALQGATFIAYTALSTALVGGLIAIFSLARSGQLSALLKKGIFTLAKFLFQALYFRFRHPSFNHLAVYCSTRLAEIELVFEETALPYGVAIALGALIVLGNNSTKFFSPLF